MFLICAPISASSQPVATDIQNADLVQSISDEEISTQIKDLYAQTPDLNFFKIQVNTVDGIVHLQATVRTPNQVYRAIELAKSVEGVKSVDSSGLDSFEH